jgi:hypothetical protein
MKNILLLLILATFANAEDFKHNFSTELDVFGLSYHANRDYDFNEVNPGLGITMVMNSAEPTDMSHFSMIASVGSYRDSYNDQAWYILAGSRFTVGTRDGLHASAALTLGWVDGSGTRGLPIVPFLSVGYNRYDLGITGSPETGKSGAEDSSKVIAVYLKIRLLDF